MATHYYRLSGHSDARLSSEDGARYESLEQAQKELARFVPDSVYYLPNEGGLLIYASKEECDADQDGSSAMGYVEYVHAEPA